MTPTWAVWQSAGLRDCGSTAYPAPHSPRSDDRPRGSENQVAGAASATLGVCASVRMNVIVVHPARHAYYDAHDVAAASPRVLSAGSHQTASGGVWVNATLRWRACHRHHRRCFLLRVALLLLWRRRRRPFYPWIAAERVECVYRSSRGSGGRNCRMQVGRRRSVFYVLKGKEGIVSIRRL